MKKKSKGRIIVFDTHLDRLIAIFPYDEFVLTFPCFESSLARAEVFRDLLNKADAFSSVSSCLPRERFIIKY